MICLCCAAWLAVIYFSWLRGMNSNSSIEFQRIMALHFWDNLLRCSQNFCHLIFQYLCVKDWKRILKKLCCLVTKWHMQKKSSLFFSQSSLAERRIPHFLKKRVSISSLRSKESSTKNRTRYPQACFYINFVNKLALRARDTFVIQNKWFQQTRKISLSHWRDLKLQFCIIHEL